MTEDLRRSADSRALSTIRWTGALAAGILALTLLFAHTGLHGPPCMFRTLFGLPCPGCGLTRSIIALWHGEPTLSFRYHPLGIPTMLGLACVAAWSLAFALMPVSRPWLRRIAQWPKKPWVGWAVAGLLMIVWFVRLADAIADGGVFLW